MELFAHATQFSPSCDIATHQPNTQNTISLHHSKIENTQSVYVEVPTRLPPSERILNMASTLIQTFPSTPVDRISPPSKQANELPIHIQQLHESASTTTQQSNTPKDTMWSEAEFVANLRSSSAHSGASGSVSSQQPQQGLSSLAQAAMAGGKMKTDSQIRLVEHTFLCSTQWHTMSIRRSNLPVYSTHDALLSVATPAIRVT